MRHSVKEGLLGGWLRIWRCGRSILAKRLLGGVAHLLLSLHQPCTCLLQQDTLTCEGLSCSIELRRLRFELFQQLLSRQAVGMVRRDTGR